MYRAMFYGFVFLFNLMVVIQHNTDTVWNTLVFGIAIGFFALWTGTAMVESWIEKEKK